MNADQLRRLAEARREYADTVEPNRSIILHEAAVLESVAAAMDGTCEWSDLVASYAPSWRWHDFGQHDPTPSLMSGGRQP